MDCSWWITEVKGWKALTTHVTLIVSPYSSRRQRPWSGAAFHRVNWTNISSWDWLLLFSDVISLLLIYFYRPWCPSQPGSVCLPAMVLVFTWSRLPSTLLIGLVWFPLGILLFAGVEISVLCLLESPRPDHIPLRSKCGGKEPDRLQTDRQSHTNTNT